jgi:hypothetical protein
MSVRDREEMVVARLQALAPHLDGEPDPAFRAATRARLVAMAAVRSPEPVAEPVSPLRRFLTEAPAVPSRWRTRLTAGLAGAALTVTALATVVAVSTDARPGDALYALKRGTEQTQLALAGDSRGQVLLGMARTRLEEVRALGDDAQQVVATLETMDAQTTEGAAWLTDRAVSTEDDAPLETLDDWAEVQSVSLAAARADLPADAQDDADDSLALLDDIGTRAEGLRDALDCAAGPATVGSDELGPVPGLCLPGGIDPTAPGGVPGQGEGTDPGAPPADPGQPSTVVPDPSLPPLGTPGLPVPNQPGGGILPPLPSPPSVGGKTTTPPLPLPSLTVPSLPNAPGAPGAPAGGSSSGDEPASDGAVDIEICLPPLATLGDC